MCLYKCITFELGYIVMALTSNTKLLEIVLKSFIKNFIKISFDYFPTAGFFKTRRKQINRGGSVSGRGQKSFQDCTIY